MPASDSFAEFLFEQFSPLGRITARRMFGKSGLFRDGIMFGMLADDTLYLRGNDQNRETFREAETFPPLNSAKGDGAIDLAFRRVPHRLFDEPDELLTWALDAATLIALKRQRRSDRPRARVRAGKAKDD